MLLGDLSRYAASECAPHTRHNKVSTVMKALHSVREDKSQLFERKKVRTGKQRRASHSSTQNKTKTKVTLSGTEENKTLIIFGN